MDCVVKESWDFLTALASEMRAEEARPVLEVVDWMVANKQYIDANCAAVIMDYVELTPEWVAANLDACGHIYVLLDSLLIQGIKCSTLLRHQVLFGLICEVKKESK